MITRRPCPTVRRFAMVRTLYRNATNDCALALADKAVVAWWPGVRCKGGKVLRKVETLPALTPALTAWGEPLVSCTALRPKAIDTSATTLQKR